MDNNENVAAAGAPSEESKTYTREEVDKLIQSEADKRVAQALKTQKDKFDKKLSLQNLDNNERAVVLANDRIKELENELEAYKVEKNRSDIKSVLSSRGLSAEFADILAVGDDVEASQKNIEKLDKLFKAAVKAEVDKRLGGAAPAKSEPGTSISKKDFAKMSIAEQATLAATDRELYNSLVK